NNGYKTFFHFFLSIIPLSMGCKLLFLYYNRQPVIFQVVYLFIYIIFFVQFKLYKMYFSLSARILPNTPTYAPTSGLHFFIFSDKIIIILICYYKEATFDDKKE